MSKSLVSDKGESARAFIRTPQFGVANPETSSIMCPRDLEVNACPPRYWERTTLSVFLCFCKKKSETENLRVIVCEGLWPCYLEQTPHWAVLRLRSEEKAKIDKKITCTQTEALADCHLIFKVDGTEERYSPASSHARCTPFLSVSAVPDHISLGNLILTFRTRTWLRQLFLLVYLFSPSRFLPLSLLFLYVCLPRRFILHLLRVYIKSYVTQNATRINLPPELFCWI